MRSFFLILLSLFLLSSCDELKSVLKETDGIKITFYGKLPSRIDYKYYSTTITDPGEVALIMDFVTGKEAPLYKCGYAGSLVFMKKGKKILDKVEFNVSKGCEHLIFLYKGNLTARVLKPEGIKYLRDLYMLKVKKRHWLIGE